jgi:hypothetical protein
VKSQFYTLRLDSIIIGDTVRNNVKRSIIMLKKSRIPYGYIPCRNGCGALIQHSKGSRGRPKEFCDECYKKSKKEYLKWRMGKR